MNEKTTGAAFVWVRGTGGRPEPQVWRELDYGVSDWKLKSGYIIVSHKITNLQLEWPIEALAAKFPAPAVREAA